MRRQGSESVGPGSVADAATNTMQISHFSSSQRNRSPRFEANADLDDALQGTVIIPEKGDDFSGVSTVTVLRYHSTHSLSGGQGSMEIAHRQSGGLPSTRVTHELGAQGAQV
jgi:hypothetical protein